MLYLSHYHMDKYGRNFDSKCSLFTPIHNKEKEVFMKKLFILVPLILFAIGIFSGTARGESEYAGTDTCAACHEDHYKSYIKTMHGIKGNPRSPEAIHGCESCHGPGAAHSDAGGGKDVGGIKSLGKSSPMNAEEKSAICLECHSKGMVALWTGSAHEGRNLDCMQCHSIHSVHPKNLAKAKLTEVCAECHKQIKAQLQRQSHHPVREGKVTCTDCHNPHGTIAEKLVSANYVNEKCWECHTEKRGPFLWEHAPVTENCLTCHTPHGSSHSKLLVAKRPYICQRCHSNSRHPGTLYAQSTAQAGQSVYSTMNNRLFYRSCENCHNTIHGSNHPSGKGLLR